ncbi:MAG: hypothetical protein ABI411_04790 [Tahibacter sp.]
MIQRAAAGNLARISKPDCDASGAARPDREQGKKVNIAKVPEIGRTLDKPVDGTIAIMNVLNANVSGSGSRLATRAEGQDGFTLEVP